MNKPSLGLCLALGLATGSASAVTEIRYDCWPNHDKTIGNEDIMAEFHKQNPDIKIKVLSNNWVDHHNKLTTALATGSGAGDLVCVDTEQIGPIVNSGGFANLTKEFNASKDKPLFAQFAWTQGQGMDGNQYAYPLNIGPGVMFYRREHMQDLGIDPNEVIKDWDSLLDYGVKLKEKGIPLVGHAGSLAQAIINTEVEAGNSIYFTPEGEPIVTNERFVKAFTIAQKARELGLDGRIGDWSGEWIDGLNKGTFAVQFSGAWLAGFLESWIAPTTGGKWGSADLPAGNYGSWGGTLLAIPSQSKNKEAAYKLMEFLAKNETPVIYEFKENAAFPGLLETYDEPMFDEPMPFLGGEKARRQWATIAQNIKPITPYKADNIARAVILEQALPAVVEDGKDVEEALRDAEKLIKRRMRNL